MDLIKDLFKGDKVIWIIFLFLCLISIVEVFSAASTLTYWYITFPTNISVCFPSSCYPYRHYC